MVSIYNYIIKQPSLPSVSEMLVMYFSPLPPLPLPPPPYLKVLFTRLSSERRNDEMTLFFFLFQFEALKQYIEKGGSLLILLGEGGESRFDTNINFLIEDYGIMVNNGQYVTAVHHSNTSYRSFLKFYLVPLM